jgi:tRNA A-37 threonylcarbamoyl transferase component Bud32/tetratricopeptide (TPR) repeat protein
MTDYLLAVGTHVGKYVVLEHIASGGMAEVYKARDPDKDRVVALKVIPDHLADNPTILERFRREARHAARLSHKNIVSIFERGQDEGVHFLAMEYVEGTDLHNYICEKGRLDPQEAWVITVQAARALDHACRQGITHRDIKPSNLLLSFQAERKLTVKLADMGLAREVKAGDFRVTKDGTTVGTIDYMAPEQARDSALADIRSDIYSLGCTLYHMLSGQPPFPEGGLGERIYKHLQTEVADVRLLNRKVNAPLWSLLRKMLEKDPADRFQSPTELLQALMHLGDEEAAVAPSRRRRAGKPSSDDALVPGSWRNPTAFRPPPDVAREHFDAPVDPKVAAAGQYERAKVVMATDNQELTYAHELLASCCHLDPLNTTYRRTLRQVGRALVRQNRWGRWLAPMSVLAAKAKMKVAKAARDYLKVLEYGEEVLARAPEDVPTQLTMVNAARSLGFNELGIWILEQLCKQDPEDPTYLRLLGRTLEKEDQIDKALKVWSGVLKLVPYDLEAGRKVDKLSVAGTLRRGHLGR